MAEVGTTLLPWRDPIFPVVLDKATLDNALFHKLPGWRRYQI